jgi:hypothetical protein
MSRRQFDLPSFDLRYVEGTGLVWETIVENGARWLILYDRPICDGYKVATSIVGIRIAPNYPETQLDMAYFSPPLARTDGRAVNSLTTISIDGKEFQQWSRHRSAENPWRPGEDDLSSHLALVDGWLEKEFRL